MSLAACGILCDGGTLIHGSAFPFPFPEAISRQSTRSWLLCSSNFRKPLHVPPPLFCCLLRRVEICVLWTLHEDPRLLDLPLLYRPTTETT